MSARTERWAQRNKRRFWCSLIGFILIECERERHDDGSTFALASIELAARSE
jgi:hypothetical protein